MLNDTAAVKSLIKAMCLQDRVGAHPEFKAGPAGKGGDVDMAFSQRLSVERHPLNVDVLRAVVMRNDADWAPGGLDFNPVKYRARQFIDIVPGT